MRKIFLIDGNSFIYRMFFALPEFSTKDGKVVNAIFGMAKFFVEWLVKMDPDYLIFIKDAKWQNFRHEIYADYKATRDRMPDNLRTQISDIEKMIGLMWVDIVEIEWYEADDVIGTLATKLGGENYNDIYILSWDKDLYSLIWNNVSVYDTMKKRVFNRELAEEKFWVKPEMIIDYLAIVWDKADNIPWIDWFGPKKAIELINNIWSVEEIYNEAEKVESGEKSFSDYVKSLQSCFKWKTFEKLINSKEDAFLSKRLATIDLNIDLDKHMLTEEIAWDWIVNKKFDLEDFKFKPDLLLNEKVKDFFRELEFNSLIGEQKEVKSKTWENLWLDSLVLQDNSDLKVALEKIEKNKQATLSLLEDETIDGISIYLDDKNIFYIPVLNFSNNDLWDFLTKLLNLDITLIWHNLKEILEKLDIYLDKESCEKTENNFWQISLSL